MAYDLNAGRRPLFKLTATLVTRGFIVAALFLLLLVAGRYLQARLQLMEVSRAEAALFDGGAPPCPTMTRADFAAYSNYAPFGILLWDTQIERRSGDINCILVSPSLWEGGDYMSCRFDHPIFIRVAGNGRETFFRPGNRPATLRLDHDGTARCIMAQAAAR